MDPENQTSIDINSADEKTLTQLQGIGTRLARRIIKERPFASIDELTRVRGISERDVERLRPSMSISDSYEQPQTSEDINGTGEEVPEPEHLDEMEGIESLASDEDAESENEITGGEEKTQEVIERELEEETMPSEELQTVLDVEPEDETLPTGEPSAPNASEQPEEFVEIPKTEVQLVESEIQQDDTPTDIEEESLPEQPEQFEEPQMEKPASQPIYITRGGACGLFLVGGFLILLLAVAATLGILSSINQGQLNYASPSQIVMLNSKIETLATQTQTLSEGIEGLRTRMDNLESLSSQVSEMETEFMTTREDIAEIQAQIALNQAEYDALVAQLENIDEEIQTLTTQSGRYESFLEGLRTLMEELFPQVTEGEESP